MENHVFTWHWGDQKELLVGQRPFGFLDPGSGRPGASVPYLLSC